MTDRGPASVASCRCALFFVLLPILAGCTSTDINAFNGQPPAPSLLVVVEIAPDLEVVSVDGNPSWNGRSTRAKPIRLSFAEGNHAISIRLRRDEQEGQMAVHEITTTLSDPVSIDGYFRGQRRYRIGFNESASSWQPTIEQVTAE